MLRARSGHSWVMRRLLVSTILVLLAGCGGSDDNGGTPPPAEEEEEELPPDVDCTKISPVPRFNQVRAFEVCTSCHSTEKTGSQRNGAPDDVNFNQYASAAASANQAAIEVNVGAMPPEGSNLSLTLVQKNTLFDWAMCGSPP
jgi:cytochrome c5